MEEKSLGKLIEIKENGVRPPLVEATSKQRTDKFKEVPRDSEEDKEEGEFIKVSSKRKKNRDKHKSNQGKALKNTEGFYPSS